MAVALRYVARSDVGLVRSNNQDSAYAGPHLLVVADGMGGHAGGDIASSIAIGALAPLDDDAHGPDDALEELEAALEDARDEFAARTEAEPDLAGMGTTVTAILRAGNKLAMVHLGDSRGYLLRDEVLTQVTTDHTFVQHLVDTGRITAEEAEHHPQRSVIMRVLGNFDGDFTPDLSVREARPGDRWLLCSDGLSGFVSAETIQRTLIQARSLDACADRLVQLALRAGGGDNITVVIADVVEVDDAADGEGEGEGDGQPAGAPVATIVGAAATRDVPTSAADGPAARAAALRRKAAQDAAPVEERDGEADDPGVSPAEGADEADEDEDDDRDGGPRPPRRRRWIAVLVVGVVAFLAATGLGYWWTQTQYFVGDDGGELVIARGIPQSIGPIELYTVVERTGTPTAELDGYLQDRVEQTIAAASLEEAQAMADLLAQATAGDESTG